MTTDYPGKERRAYPPLTEDQIDKIATAAAAKVIEQIYAEVGKSIVKKIFWVAGVIAISLLLWLSAKGQLHIQ